MRSCFFSLFLLLAAPVFAQDFLGYSHSNYAGIVGAAYNPASVADNVYSLDILLAGVSIEAGNNYVAARRGDFTNPNFNSSYLKLRERKTKKAAFIRNEILLPGVMFSNEKYGWGVDLRIRTYVNVDGLEQPIAHIFARELKDPAYFQQDLSNKHIGVTELTWGEIGGTYARTIWNGAEHFVSVGIRPKFLLGMASAYAFVNDAAYNFRDDSSLTVIQAEAEFAHSDNFTFSSSMQPSWKLGFNPGLGLDAGIVYEHRSDVLQPGKEDKYKPWPGFRERAVYKYRIGLSLTDLGAIRFKPGEFSHTYSVNASLWDINDQAFDSTSPTTLYNTFEYRTGTGRTNPYWMRLPLAFNADYDYRIMKDVYVNATAFSALYLRNNDGKKVHELTRLTIAPRWETRWLGAWMPVSFSRLGNLTMGAGVRLGPLVLGTNDILFYLLKNKYSHSADAYFVLKVPLFPLPGHTYGSGNKKGGGKVDDCAD